MKYVLLVISLLPILSQAQSKLTGLGPYRIGITTPDSLKSTVFEEQPQAYVKGTIALPCTHIRSFKANGLNLSVSGLLISNLALFFYDNRLFKLSCDYSDNLREFFLMNVGQGILLPTSRLTLCTTGTPLLQWGEVWRNADLLALLLYRNGYEGDCQKKQTVRLMIASQKLSALASDCELTTTDPLMGEFEQAINYYSLNQPE